MSDLERSLEQAIRERDAEEECLSQMYYIVTGRSPEWSNRFGHAQSLEDVGDVLAALKVAAVFGCAHSSHYGIEALDFVKRLRAITVPNPQIADDVIRIEALSLMLNEAADRIEALEAALREIGDPLMPHRVDGVGRVWEQATIQTMQKIARAALAPERNR